MSRPPRVAVIVFPGTWSDRDCRDALVNGLGQEAEYVWHKDTDVSGFDALVLPGGFAHGDYLRTGAIARFSPVMASVQEFAAAGIDAERLVIQVIPKNVGGHGLGDRLGQPKGLKICPFGLAADFGSLHDRGDRSRVLAQ